MYKLHIANFLYMICTVDFVRLYILFDQFFCFPIPQ